MENLQKIVILKLFVFYNPKYNLDGTESSYFTNSRIGSLFNNYLIIFYNLRAPQNLFIYVLPIVIVFHFCSEGLELKNSFLHR